MLQTSEREHKHHLRYNFLTKRNYCNLVLSTISIRLFWKICVEHDRERELYVCVCVSVCVWVESALINEARARSRSESPFALITRRMNRRASNYRTRTTATPIESYVNRAETFSLSRQRERANSHVQTHVDHHHHRRVFLIKAIFAIDYESRKTKHRLRCMRRPRTMLFSQRFTTDGISFLSLSLSLSLSFSLFLRVPRSEWRKEETM